MRLHAYVQYELFGKQPKDAYMMISRIWQAGGLSLAIEAGHSHNRRWRRRLDWSEHLVPLPRNTVELAQTCEETVVDTPLYIPKISSSP